MSGLKSRNKGCRNEYLARDHIRAQGYKVDRIPASGASQGFKGDLRVMTESGTLIVEVKSRKKYFECLHEANLIGPVNLTLTTQVRVGNSLADVVEPIPAAHIRVTLLPTPQQLRKLERCAEMLGPADILMVKDDRRPWIYMRFIK